MAALPMKEWPIVRDALHFALPPRCPACGAIVSSDHEFCASCWSGLDFLGMPECAGCGLPFEIDLGPDLFCGACLEKPKALDGVRAAFAYGDISRAVILKLKHGRRPMVANLVATQLRRRMIGLEEGVLVPVPLHRWRLWSRGYNQSALIARVLASEFGQSLLDDALIRTKRTPPMGHHAAGKRKKLLAGAFAVNLARISEIAGRQIILVDDVYTTGATANGCAKALKQAGATKVTLLCWARVVETLRQ